jgi:hypothetical protein
LGCARWRSLFAWRRRSGVLRQTGRVVRDKSVISAALRGLDSGSLEPW